VHTASIGPVTSATLRECGLPVDIEAKQFDIPGLIGAILEAKSRIQTG
jgi:uroporphyrinogen-III synthase